MLLYIFVCLDRTLPNETKGLTTTMEYLWTQGWFFRLEAITVRTMVNIFCGEHGVEVKLETQNGGTNASVITKSNFQTPSRAFRAKEVEIKMLEKESVYFAYAIPSVCSTQGDKHVPGYSKIKAEYGTGRDDATLRADKFLPFYHCI